MRTRALQLIATMVLATGSLLCVHAETIASTPERSRLAGLDENPKAIRDWVGQSRIYFLESSMPWLRLQAELILIDTEFPGDRKLYREEFERKRERLAQVLETVPDDPLSLVVATGVCRKPWWSLCDEYQIKERLIAADPENLEAHLVRLRLIEDQFRFSTNETYRLLAVEPFREALESTSKASYWQTYEDLAAKSYYDAHLAFIQSNPPPESVFARQPDYVLAFWMSQFLRFSNHRDTHMIYGPCTTAPQEDIVCQRVSATLLQVGHPKAHSLARGLLPKREKVTLRGLADWRKSTMVSFIEDCETPRWLIREADWPALPRAFFPNHVAARTQFGSKQANILSADAEYALDPSRYLMRPSDCQDLLLLGSEEMGAVLGEEDPKPYWLDYVARTEAKTEKDALLATAANEPFVPATEAELSAMAEQLAWIESTEDPLMTRLVRQGMPAVPHLIDQLCSDDAANRASLVILRMNNPAVIPPLLDQMGWEQSEEIHCETSATLLGVFEGLQYAPRPMPAQGVDEEWIALLRQWVCVGADETVRSAVAKAPTGWPIVARGTGVADASEMECAGQTLNLEPIEDAPYRLEEHELVTLRADIYEFGPLEGDISAFLSAFGGKPEMLAKVHRRWSSSGSTTLWIRVNGDWRMLRQISRWIS